MRRVVHWREDDFDRMAVGGKARALGTLCRAGLAVPEWCVVLPDAPPAGATADDVRKIFSGGPGSLAVRSSASGEDGAVHSFAGQLDSFLNVPVDELAARIAGVRESGFSDRIVAYRRQAGLSLPPPVPAVIVQRMVGARAAGVAFSADPVSGRRGMAVVAAVGGLGDALVSGAATGDTFHVDRAGRIVSREGSRTAQILADDRVAEIARLARRAEQIFGVPQDVEWAFDGETVWVLQSRPITSLAALADPDGLWQLWDNSNIAESYCGVTTPLTFSFARHVYEEVYRQFVKILHVPARRIEAGRDVFGRMLGLIRGRVYYNMLSWYRVLAMLPGFAVNRRFMEQMMGVREPLPDEVAATIAAPRQAGLRDWLEIAATLCGLAWNHLRLDAKIAAFYRRLDAALPRADLETMRPDELAAAFRRLQSQLLTRWDAPLINDFFAMVYFGVSRRLVAAWCGDADGTLQNDLIACQGGIISAEPARRILAMAEMARAQAGFPELLEHGALTDILRGAPAEFSAAWQDYVEKFGDRCLEELKLESATLHDDPLPLLRSIGCLARSPRAEAGQVRPSLAAAAKDRVDRALAGKPVRRIIFGQVMRMTRARVRDRENLRFERTRVFGRVRRIFVELGRRFHALAQLDDPRDIFFLTVEEALGFVEGTAVTTDLRALVALRRVEFAAAAADPPSDRFVTRGVVHHANPFRAEHEPSAAVGGDQRKGMGCCPGIVRGPARVILDPRSAEIVPGEILVAPRTDPGWILLFPSAAGILVEHGSLLSHSAIVAREMGIPAVVAVDGLISWLQTGDLVEMDGATGSVRRLTDANHASMP